MWTSSGAPPAAARRVPPRCIRPHVLPFGRHQGEEEIMFYNIVKDFQSGIVGILGFIGVIITLWWNAHVAAVARNEQFHDAQVTPQSALHRELESIRQELMKIRTFASDKSLKS